MVDVSHLSDAEQRVWAAFPAGTPVDFRTGNAKDDDPAGGVSWGPDRQVRAEVLNALLCGAVEVEPGLVGTVYLQGARIIGSIGLFGIIFKHVLWLEKCSIADGIELRNTTTKSIRLGYSQTGPINLIGAKIDGTFSLAGSHLRAIGQPALEGGQLTVSGSMFCNDGFHTDGRVHLRDASIGNSLNFRGAHLDGKGGVALDAERLTVTGGMFCGNGFHADGEVRLLSAKIGILSDDRESWPQRLNLHGLAYGDLTYMPARQRLDWLNRSVRTAGYSPQPYEQLAACYRRLGHDEQARRVLLAKQRQRTRLRPW